MKIAVLTIAFNEEHIIGQCLSQFPNLYKLVLVPKYSIVPDNTFKIAERHGAEVVSQHWNNEAEQRNWGLARLYDYDYVLIVDPDEFYTKKDLNKLLNSLQGEACYRTARVNTYWKDPDYQLDPPDSHLPLIAIDPKRCQFLERRIPRPADSPAIQNYQPIIDITTHHLQFSKPDNRMWQKLKMFEHSAKFDAEEYWTSVWKGWDKNSIVKPWGKEQSQLIYKPIPQEIWKLFKTTEFNKQK